jgi:hypothetical protein
MSAISISPWFLRSSAPRNKTGNKTATFAIVMVPAFACADGRAWSTIPKSGNRFSDKIMLKGRI